MEKKNSERFLNAFIEIESRLKEIVNNDVHKAFYQLVDRAARKNESIEKYKATLKEYAELRNAIVHKRIDGEAIAEPHTSVVEDLEFICKMITKPPKLEDEFLRKVIKCSSYDRISVAARRMFGNSFTQIPVYDSRKFVGLLTTDSMARWMSANLESGAGYTEDVDVRSILEFNEHKENCIFISRTATVFDAISAFEQWHKRGARLNAIIITEMGDRNENPLGILTLFDLPRLYSTISK
jgi:predicted transcriptional regulator